jgi:alpha-1,6-mannosyltransferase
MSHPHPVTPETPVRIDGGAPAAPAAAGGPQRVPGGGAAPSLSSQKGTTASKRCPVYRWGQREDTVQLTLELAKTDARAASLNFAPGGTDLVYAHGEHELRLSLHGRVIAGDTEVVHLDREVQIVLRKADRGRRWPTLQRDGAPKVKSCEKVDWDMWVDSDAEDEGDDGDPRAGDPADPMASMMKRAKATKKEAEAAAAAAQPTLVKIWNALPTRHFKLQDLVILVVLWAHLFFAPLNKVEESFGTQAAHDLLFHGPDVSAYDHKTFPGVVPRTFAGPALLSLIVLPLKHLLVAAVGVTGESKLLMLYAVRGALACLGALSLARLRRAVDLRFGEAAGWCFCFLTVTQFHVMYYGSRLLPNTFALWIVTYAMALWLEERQTAALTAIAAAAAVFRCELAALLAPVALAMVVRREVSLLAAVRCVVAGAVLAIAVTAPLDSLLWGRPIWPEWEVFRFNVLENRSGEYGTSPWHWYATSALPRALLVSLPLVPFASYIERRRVGGFVLPLVAFVALYSLLPHKELRFVLYVVPPLTAAASVALARVVKWSDKNEAWIWLAFAYVGAGAMVTAMILTVSALNYPGGSALRQLHKLEDMNPSTVQPYVHIGNAAAQSGVNLFLERGPPWRYSREEGLSAKDLRPRRFTHVITEFPKVPGYKMFYKLDSFRGVRWELPPIPNFKPYIYVHRREDLRPISRAEYEAREKSHTPPEVNIDHGEETFDGEL